jgi:hypothetical protein
MRMTVLGWVFTGLLLLLVVTCIAASRGAIPLNVFFGVRLPPLMRSDAAWRAGHAAGVVPAVIAFVVALVCSAIGIVAPVAYWGSIVAMVGGVVWVFVRASRAANAS